MSFRTSRRRGPAAVAAVLVAGLAVAGCSAATQGHRGGTGAEAATNPQLHHARVTPPVVPATLTASVRPAATDVRVDTVVRVRADHGKLTSVVFRGDAGTREGGSYNADHTAWTASGGLDPATRYTLHAQAVDAAGKVTRSTRTFTTQDLTLDEQTYPSVTPLAGQVMGIGMPVIVKFDVPVSDRANFQKHMFVHSTPAQQGTWHWISSQEVHWRPKTYWQPGTKVDVDLRLNGVDAGNGIYGQLDRQVHFSIGRGVLVKANVASDHMQVFVDGKLARNIPITAGKPGGFQTRSGVKLISEKYLSKTMNSATVGIDPNSPEGYDIADVRYAMRVTNSGEFLHAAPWSVYAQGHYNVSHGCVGMSTGNAHWLFERAEVGTPVVVTGSSRPLEPQNGWTDWNMTWKQWTAGSALR